MAARSSPSEYHSPESLDELTEENIRTIIKLDDVATAHRSFSDRIADGIATFCGSIHFVWLHIVWFGGWIVFNAWPGSKHLDPFPFTFLTLIVSLEAIFLSTFILISQNHASRQSERRNQLDLQINLLAEQENTKMLNLLEQIAEKIGVDPTENPSLKILDQATNPARLAEQIDTAIERGMGEDSPSA